MPSNFLSTNPYIGSRSFQRGERLYGRDSEARDLLSLLVAERIVLLHSPSGAGKTSLIQAALIPALEQRDFRVSPPIRVNRIPEGPGNRYLQSVIASLEDDPAIPTEDRLPAEELATLSLDAYLERRRSNTDEDEVLIFDQFEEVLTVDPIDLAEKHAFFKELGVALRRLHRWALFAIREDYLAALSPFVRPLPTRLSNTFRLDLLGLNAARRAMQGPAESVGVDFTTEAARQLSENLARLVVTGRDGKTEERIGLTVEPVQLQVVCRRLWDQRFADERSGSGDTVVAVRPQITVHDVEAMGSVDQALSDYYRDGIAKAVAAGGAERTIRSWFDRDLITSQGIRGQVLYGSEQMRNLNDVVINALRNVYLIRADERRGSTWYELAHDRLIDPVRTNNRVWFETNLSALQRQTELWIERGQPDSLLFRGEELATAEAWARGFSGTLTADERSFLEKSRAEQARTQRLRNLTIGAVAAAAIASVAFVVALVFFGLARNNERLANENFNKAQTQEALALEQKGLAEQNAAAAQAAERTAVANYELAEANRREAEQNARISKARELAAASLNRLEVDPELSVLLGIAALNATDSGDPPIPAAADALRQAVNASRVKQTIALDDTTAIDAEYATVVQNPAGSRIAALGADGNLRIWTTGGTTDTPIVEPAHSAAGSAIAYSPDGNRLFTSGDDGLLQLWDATSLQPLASVTGSPDFGGARAAAFSPDGERIALANRSPTALVLDATTLQLQTVISTSSTIYHLAFDPSNQVLGIAESDGISLWDAVEGTQVGFFAHQIEVYTLAFSPDGALVISGDDLGTIRIWDVNDATAAGVRPLVTIQGIRGRSICCTSPVAAHGSLQPEMTARSGSGRPTAGARS
ncbi:MAG: hypothetical protein HC822_12695 [Oscillochloris sp.]|nr:hypothetical protein [Oscillochloris sp.]